MSSLKKIPPLFSFEKNNVIFAGFLKILTQLGKFDLYKVPLKSLSVGSHNFEYILDSEYFKKIDSPEVQRGKVSAKVTVKYNGNDYEVSFQVEGSIVIPCDRCLDDMDLPINQKSRLIVKLGLEYSEESDEIIIIPESEGEINLAWFLYEVIALSIPIKHVHAPGKCNKSMTIKLNKHTARSTGNGGGSDFGSDEGSDSGFASDNGSGGGVDIDDEIDDFDELDIDIEPDDVKIDPRWDELKKIIDNN